MDECLKCKGNRVVKGRIENYENHGPAIFRPQELRTFALTITGGTQLVEEAFACLNCGLVWSSTPPEKLATFIQKNCKQPSGMVAI
jgi:hypothetical protein